jgi:hypothetical protein
MKLIQKEPIQQEVDMTTLTNMQKQAVSTGHETYSERTNTTRG